MCIYSFFHLNVCVSMMFMEYGMKPQITFNSDYPKKTSLLYGTNEPYL